MLILVVLFAFVQQINNNLYVLDILCLDHFYFAGVPRIILLSRIPHTHKSLPARTRTRTRPSIVAPRRTLLRWVPLVPRECRSLVKFLQVSSVKHKRHFEECRCNVTKQLMVAIDFHSIFFHTMDVNGYSQLFGNQLSSEYLLLCLTKEKLIQVWNNSMVN